MTRDELMHRIDQALAEGGGLMTWPDLVQRARERRAQIWGGDDAVIATEILEFPRLRALDCTLAAGSLAGVWALEPEIEAFARAEGCAELWCHGRPGWGRVGERAGWRLRSMFFTKSLGAER
jgi:hypothetical protein